MKKTVLAMLVCLGLSAVVSAQEGDKKEGLVLPVPSLGTPVQGVKSDDKQPTKIEEGLYRASQGIVLTGLVWDMGTTAISISRPLNSSYTVCWDGNCQYVESSRVFEEKGWSRTRLGTKKVPAVIIANTALDTGILIASHYMYKKSGIWWKIAAIGLNFAQGIDRVQAAVHNQSAMAEAQREMWYRP